MVDEIDKSYLDKNNLVLLKKGVYKSYIRNQRKYFFLLNFMRKVGATHSVHFNNALLCLEQTHSQQFQEMFAFIESDYKANGFFVEFGVIDGILNSNTYVLEKHFGWSGILAEPAKRWHSQLKANRSAVIEECCVWNKSNDYLMFCEVPSGLSGLHSHIDQASINRHEDSDKSSYEVETISLLDLLDKHRAPEFIDYISIDTEGSEFEILKDFDFRKYRFGCITVEHANDQIKRDSIYNLLTANGYLRKYPEYSKDDDWFVSV